MTEKCLHPTAVLVTRLHRLARRLNRYAIQRAETRPRTPAAWHAFATTCWQVAGRLEDLQRLVSVQADDEGLWFVGRTAPEAYLQQELRRLHAAIEGTPPLGEAPCEGGEAE